MWDIEDIKDWGIRTQNYSDEQKAFYHDMVPKITEMKGIAKSSTGWELVVDSKSDMVKIETKRSIRGILMMRAQGPIDWAPTDIRRCMQYRPMRNEWDLNVDVTKTM